MDNHRDDRENVRNQQNKNANNVDQYIGIKLVIPEYDGKLKLDEFMDWLVRVCKIFFTQANDGVP